MKIAIQGIKGSYHHQVAQSIYGTTELLECTSFEQLVHSISDSAADKAVMAIGNSIAGSILPNYGLITNNKLSITDEYYLSIHHQLMALKGQNIDDIKEIHSHPMALLQCGSFLKKHAHIRVVETDDTAAAAYRIATQKKTGIAAIAAGMAAHLYQLEIIEQDIQEAKNNFTRFVMLDKKARLNDPVNKATINFTTNHEPGSLGKILSRLGEMGINLSKIQSIPIIEKPFLFSFVADLEFDNLAHFKNAQVVIKKLTKSLHILGVYTSRSL